MMAGTALAQLVPIAVSPLLSRLYTPEQFGTFGLFSTIVGLAAVLATGRYELSIMLPKRDVTAAHLGVFALCLAVAVLTVGAYALWLFPERASGLFGDRNLKPWISVLPASSLAMAVLQVFNYGLTRVGMYGTIAISGVLQQIGMAVVAVGFGLWLPSSNWLIGGFLTGQAIALAWQVRYTILPLWAGTRDGWTALWEAAWQHRKFPIFNLPYSFLGNFSAGFLLLGFSAFGYLDVTGYVHLSRRILYIPAYFLSASLGQVYFQYASQNLGKPELEKLTIDLLASIGRVCAGPFVLFLYWSGNLLELVNGPSWRAAGPYAAAFAPVAFCCLFTSWPERIFEVTGKQKLSLITQLVADGVTVPALWLVLRQGGSPHTALVVYSILYCSYHSVYLLMVFHAAGFSKIGLARVIGGLSFQMASAAIVLWLILQLPVKSSVQLAVSGLAILAHSGAASFQLLRQGSLFGDQQGSA
jgi:O-antigen/teichoic acid export membrane protein